MYNYNNYLNNHNNLQFIPLNKQGTAYITIEFISNNLSNKAYDNFKQMYLLRPEKRHNIIIYEKEAQVNRYSQSYLHTPTDLSHTNKSSYMYSGYDTSNNNNELPELFKPYYDYIREKSDRYNQVVANWYSDGMDYISQHADCERGMIENGKVAILTLYRTNKLEQEDYRHMTIRPKEKFVEEALHNELKIRLTHGMILTMHGTMQKEFKHGIEQNMNTIEKRISLSFRQMINTDNNE